MKKFVLAAALTLCCAAAAPAADSVVFPARNGDVSFDHKGHSSRLECKLCHGNGAPAKIAIDRDAAHKLCKGCHTDRKAGPVKCGECHKK